MTTRLIPLALVGVLALTACGGDDVADVDETESPVATDTPTATATESTATDSPTATMTDTSQAGPPVQLEGDVNARGTATVSGGSVAVELGDFFFDPTYIQAEPGQSVQVELTNNGSAAHTFTIEDQDVDVTLDPGQSETVEVTIPQEGSVRFICTFHVGQGMQGAFFTQ